MKIFLTFVFIIFSLFLKAQIFFEISNGYAFPLKYSELAFPYYNGNYDVYLTKDPIYNSQTNSYYYIEDHIVFNKHIAKINFSTGYQLNCSIGYYIGKYFGLSIGYNYNNTLNSFKNKQTYFYSSGNDFYGNIQGKDELKYTFYAINKSCLLNSVFQYPISKKITPFVKFGISRSKHVIYVKKTSIFTNYFDNLTESDGFKEKYYGNYSLGYVISLGTKYNIKNFSFSFECRFLFDNYNPPKAYSYNYYKINLDGTYDSSIPSDHEIILEDYLNGGDVTLNSNNPDLNEKRYKNNFEFSTISLNFGIQYNLRFKKKEKF